MAALTIAGTGVSLLGEYQQAKGEQAQANYQAQIADRNAKLADNQQQDAIQRGDLAAEAQARRAAQIRGQQIAAMSANGQQVGFGSAADIVRDTETGANRDTGNIVQNAFRESQGYAINAANYRASAVGDRAAADQAMQAGYLKMGSTILGSAVKVGSIYANNGKIKN